MPGCASCFATWGAATAPWSTGSGSSAPSSFDPGDVFEIGRSFWTVREVRLRRPRPSKASELDPTGTCNPHLHHIHRTLHRLARSSIPILLRGETGTGKEYLARAVHAASDRQGPFILANLGAMGEERVESLLFGDAGTPGLFEQPTAALCCSTSWASSPPRSRTSCGPP